MGVIIFRTLKKSKRVIIQQNINFNERYTSGAKKGQVKRKRLIRYCKGLSSIFVDEQLKITDDPKQTTIMIEDGDLRVNVDDIYLLEFMRKSGQNQANGGKLFKELDIEKEDMFELEKYNTIDDAKELIRKSDEATLKGIAIQFFGISYKHKTDSQVQIMLRTRVDNDVEFAKKVTKYLSDNNNKEKQIVNLALVHNIISVVDGKKIAWADDGDIIYVGSQPKDVIAEFSTWVKTNEEGRANLKIISEKLDTVI